MCAVNDGNYFFRPMSKADVAVIAAEYPSISQNLVYDVFMAMTDHNTVKPAVLVMILEGIRRLEAGEWGNSSHGATFAYSALQIRDGGDGEIFHRFQDPIMAHVHDAMLQFALAERNMRMVQKVLSRYGYNLTHFCDCGCGITRDGDEYMGSNEYLAVNYLRSYSESIGAPVHSVASIDELPLPLTDMHQHEVHGYMRVWGILQSLPIQAFDGDRALSSAFQYMNNMRGGRNASCQNRQGEHVVGRALPTASHAPQ